MVMFLSNKSSEIAVGFLKQLFIFWNAFCIEQPESSKKVKTSTKSIKVVRKKKEKCGSEGTYD